MLTDPDLTLQIVLLVLGATALTLVWRSGALKRDALAAGPERDTGLRLLDLPVAVLLMALGGWVAFGLMDHVIGGPPTIGGLSTLEHAGAVLVYQVFAQGLPAAYVLMRVAVARGGIAGVRALGLNLRNARWQLKLAAVALLAGVPMLMGLNVLVLWLAAMLKLRVPEIGHDLLVVLQQADSLAGLATLVLAVVVVAAVLEEVLYRGLLQSALVNALGARWRWTCIFIAAGLFTFMHIGMGTFDPDGEGGVTWNALPALFALALILGWLYERTGSLWPPILLHAGFNAVNIALVMLFFE